MAKILFINEDPRTIHTMKEHLISEGHDVSIVNRAQDGITSAVTSKPDVIFVDPILPGVTGSQICFKLRKNVATRETPIIMLDASGQHPHIERFARAMGITEFVQKPLKVVELGEMVGRYAQVKSSQDAHEVQEVVTQAIIYLNRACPEPNESLLVDPNLKKLA